PRRPPRTPRGKGYLRHRPLTSTLAPPVTPALRDGILDLWADVTNAGGAVGFVPPVDRERIRPELVRQFVAMAEERSRLLVGHDEDRSEEHTSELQSRENLVCRLLLEKKNE